MTADKFQIEQYAHLCEEAARRHHVVSEIHPQDFIFHFLVENPVFDDKNQAIQYYFNEGEEVPFLGPEYGKFPPVCQAESSRPA